MSLKLSAVPVIALLFGSSFGVAKPLALHERAVVGYGQYTDNWNAPPRGFNQIQRQGFMDGVEGARKDVDNHRQPDVNNRDEYRHPNVDSSLREQYREGFASGYQSAMSHLMGGQSYQTNAPSRAWNLPPDGWNDIQRRGFRDGMDGAQKDVDNHRQPDVNNRDEYRHPNVEPGLQEQYREGFARGYQSAMSRLMGGQPYQSSAPFRAWDLPPDGWNDIQRRGFRDGIDGAQRDIDNHRQPNVNNRDEYRHPNVEPGLQQQYREGFAGGYQSAMSHLLNGQNYQTSAPYRPWDTPPDDWNDIQRRGFRDGIDGAQRDIDNHRRPDVNNRDEYRNPNVPQEMRNAYRESFRRGYEQAIAHLQGDTGPR